MERVQTVTMMTGNWLPSAIDSANASPTYFSCEVQSRSRSSMSLTYVANCWHEPTWVPVAFMARAPSMVVEGEVGTAGSRRNDDNEAQQWPFNSTTRV